MKIIIVNTYDTGGAANSCLRLYAGLLKIGKNPRLLLRKHTKNLPSVDIIEPLQPKYSFVRKAKKDIKKFLKKFIFYSKPAIEEISFVWKRSPKLELFSYPNANFDLTQATGYKDADIVNLHWVANFLDYENFFRKNKKPVVWTLHDMNPFTGGEHYLELYEGIDDEGLPVKRIIKEFEKQEFEKVIQIKKRALNQCNNLTIVAPSRWLANEAKNSEVFSGRPVHCIPYGLNSEIFAPRNKSYSRKLFNIPEDKLMILFVAESTGTQRKGFAFLQKAMEQLKNEDIILCSVGSKKSELMTTYKTVDLGSINDERLLSAVYSAADVFVIPSIMDNLPNTVLESLMCGTPVIGFPVGGIPDMVVNGENGLLTGEISVSALVEALNKFISKPEMFDSKKIRIEALKKYDERIQAQKYLELFNKILNN